MDPRSERRRRVIGGRAQDEAGRLARLKAAIQTGEYETPEKLEKTLRNLLRDLRQVRPPVGVSRADETGGERP